MSALACACPCGASTFTVSGSPLVRFKCHCRVCQSLYKLPFADVTAFRGSAIRLPDSSRVQFRKYRPPPALSRGTCPTCGAPVVGFMGPAMLPRVAFVPSRNIGRPDGLPAPRMHIFYDRRVADIADELPKIEGYWPSMLAVSRSLVRAVVRG